MENIDNITNTIYDTLFNNERFLTPFENLFPCDSCYTGCDLKSGIIEFFDDNGNGVQIAIKTITKKDSKLFEE